MAKKRIPKLKDWKNVDAAVGTIGQYDREMGSLQSEYDQEVAKLKARLVSRIDELHNEKVALERAVEEFVLAHRNEVQGSTRQLTTGQVEVKATPPKAVCYEGDEETIKLIKRKGLEDQFLRVKETVNKTAIRDAKLDERQLKALRVRMESREAVTIRPLSSDLSKELPTEAA